MGKACTSRSPAACGLWGNVGQPARVARTRQSAGERATNACRFHVHHAGWTSSDRPMASIRARVVQRAGEGQQSWRGRRRRSDWTPMVSSTWPRRAGRGRFRTPRGESGRFPHRCSICVSAGGVQLQPFAVRSVSGTPQPDGDHRCHHAHAAGPGGVRVDRRRSGLQTARAFHRRPAGAFPLFGAPGKANVAVSSFASATIREPLNGIDYGCPVPLETLMWMCSPAAWWNLVRAFELPSQASGDQARYPCRESTVAWPRWSSRCAGWAARRRHAGALC